MLEVAALAIILAFLSHREKTIRRKETDRIIKLLQQGVTIELGLPETGLLVQLYEEDLSLKPFANRAEMVEAFKDSRYKNDIAFRTEVQKRMSISDFNDLTGTFSHKPSDLELKYFINALEKGVV